MNITSWRDPGSFDWKMRCDECGEVSVITNSVLAAMGPKPAELFKPENFKHVCQKLIEAKPEAGEAE